jgi:hypothetical protein
MQVLLAIAIFPASVWIGGVIFAAADCLKASGGSLKQRRYLSTTPDRIETMYAIFACQKNKSRAVDPPCLDPLSYGRDGEPQPHLLLRRGRVQLFESEAEAIDALQATIDSTLAWTHEFNFLILKCDKVDMNPQGFGLGVDELQ